MQLLDTEVLSQWYFMNFENRRLVAFTTSSSEVEWQVMQGHGSADQWAGRCLTNLACPEPKTQLIDRCGAKPTFRRFNLPCLLVFLSISAANLETSINNTPRPLGFFWQSRIVHCRKPSTMASVVMTPRQILARSDPGT